MNNKCAKKKKKIIVWLAAAFKQLGPMSNVHHEANID